jgi:hypothetical protein
MPQLAADGAQRRTTWPPTPSRYRGPSHIGGGRRAYRSVRPSTCWTNVRRAHSATVHTNRAVSKNCDKMTGKTHV